MSTRETLITIPVVEETARVGKRAVSRSAVEVSKRVTEREETVDTSSVDEEVVIERVPRNVWLDAPLAARREGDAIVVPVMEEVTVVEKRLVLREELYIRTRRVRRPSARSVRLRQEEVRVVRKK